MTNLHTLPASEATVPATDAEIERWEPNWSDCSMNSDKNGSMVDYEDHIAALRATREQAIRECAENVWQPIETAPKDGTHFIGWDENTGAVETYWYVHPVVQAWVAVEVDCNDYEFEPTLWVPKPLSLSQVRAKK